MRTIKTTFETLGGEVLVIGRKGENNATKVLIDCAEAMEKYPNTEPALYVTAPDGTVYEKTIEETGGVAAWTVDSTDTEEAGVGSVRVDLTHGENTVVSSAECMILIIKTNGVETNAEQ